MNGCECLSIDSLKQELAGDSPSPLERLLVDRVVCCWSAVFHAELMQQHAQQHDRSQSQHYERRLDRANRRFCFAVRQLGMFQRVSVERLVVGLEDLFNPAAEDDMMFGLLESGVRRTALEVSLVDKAFANL